MIPRISSHDAHGAAIRLCSVIYFCAFLGNVIDGPVMWLLTPPGGGFTASSLITLNAMGMIAAVLAVVKPNWWLALSGCWIAWYYTYKNGNGSDGDWFFDSWDTMLMDVGWLCVLLSMSRSARRVEPRGSRDSDVEDSSAGLATLLLRKQGATVGDEAGFSVDGLPDDCGTAGRDLQWSLSLTELSLTLVAFRLFFGCGLEKLEQGSQCWKDFTCLSDFFEMQMCPTFMAWYLHNFTSNWMKAAMQAFAINLGELAAPALLLGSGMGITILTLLQSATSAGGKEQNFERYLKLLAHLRFASAVCILCFVAGMFSIGNFAFLHPLSVACASNAGALDAAWGWPSSPKVTS
eukprot:TRINITY_DN8501_c0_g1_i6.p1 TRINITY_DN8501_c0_g1~~TRINITY_DN8501_c0_g1_i6.p1  ORF type:complete len:349 (-),score=66.66 TRINITY_DN8501_c0_g1_i6:114-1160(-)